MRNLLQAKDSLELQKFMHVRLRRYIVPIYGISDRGDPFLRGSGIIITRNGQYYLASAKHVFDQARRDGSVCLHVTETNFAGVKGPQLTTGRGPEVDASDQSDIVVVRLNENVPKPPYLVYQEDKLIVDVLAIEGELLQSSKIPRAGTIYTVIGYPESKNKFKHAIRYIPVELHAHRDISPSSDVYEKLKVNERNNLLFKFDRYQNANKPEISTVFPEPEGMSGGPIFEIFENPENGDYEFSVAGILTKQHPKERLMQGTDIYRIKDMIRSLDERMPPE